MATLYIEEYDLSPPITGGEILQIASQPAVTQQTVSIGSSTQSSAFNAATNYVRLHTDATCHVLFGTNPTATTSKARMVADSTEYFRVPRGTSMKVAVIAAA